MQKAKYAYRCVSRSFNCIFYSNFSNSYRKPSVLIDVPKRNFSQSSNSNNTPIDDEPGCDESSANNLESESNPNISQETPKKGVLVKSTVPDYFPELLAIPVGRRPIFPGFYKTITIYNTDVAKAVINTFKKGQPFIGLFMSKSITDPIIMRDLNNNQKKILDANPDEHHSEIIKSLDEIQKVGVLAQIVNIIPGLKINEDGKYFIFLNSIKINNRC